jgi:hypothetical protein
LSLFNDEILSEVILTIGTFDWDITLQKYVASFIDLIEFFFYYWFILNDKEFFFFLYLLNLNQWQISIFLRLRFFYFRFFFSYFLNFFFYSLKDFFYKYFDYFDKSKNQFWSFNQFFFLLKKKKWDEFDLNFDDRFSFLFDYYFDRLKLYHYFWNSFVWDDYSWWFFLHKRSYLVISFYKDFRMILNQQNFWLIQNQNYFNFNFLIFFLRSIYYVSSYSFFSFHDKFFIPIIYIKTTLSNVFVYILINNKIVWKKSCGELQEVYKKGRRQIKNVFLLGDWLVRALKYYRLFYMFFFFKIFVNGYDSLWSPICFSLNYYLNHFKFENIDFWFEQDWFNKNFNFLKKDLKNQWKWKNNWKNKWRNNWKNKRKKKTFQRVMKQINFIRKFYFKLWYIRDVTSWPFNGCKTKGKFLC